MISGYDLRKPLRFGAVCLVTSGAEDGSIELCRLNARVISMVRQCAVTSFAGDYNVFAMTLLLSDVGVAGLTSLVARMDDRIGCDFGDSGPAEMTILAKTLGNDRCAHNHKCREHDQHECGQSDEMVYVFKQVRLPRNAIRITFPDTCTSHLAGER